MSRATAELIWLNEKEEEELAYDWSDNNPNIAAKKNYFSVSAARAGAAFDPLRKPRLPADPNSRGWMLPPSSLSLLLPN